MSNRRKNNHYHYAEKFDDRNRRSAKSVRAFMPFKSVIISLVVLLMFGLTCTTFSVYVTENEPEYDPEHPSILMQARNIKASRDIAFTGANGNLASTGATWSFSGGYLYFEKPSTWKNNASSIQLVIGKSSYSSCYTMNSISNTNYYVVSLPNSGWGDANYMAVMGNSSAWNSGSWGSDNLNNASNKTSTYTAGITSSSGQRYIFDGSLTYKGTDNDSMNTITLKAHACYSTNGSSYTADNSTGGTVKITSYYFSAYNSIQSSDTGDTATADYKAAKTKSTTNSTFTASNANGYQFEGWYDASSGGTLVSSSSSYSYSTNSGNKEIYARFVKKYTVTVQKMSGVTDTLKPTGGGTVTAGQSVTITAPTPQGVNFTGWTFTGSHTGGSASSASTTITPTSDVTATANYTLKAPKNLTLIYDTYKILGYSSYTPNTHSAQTQTANGSGSVISYSYDIAQHSSKTVNLTKGTDYSIDTSTGAVTANVPGKYVVTMTATDSCYGLTSTATTTATVEVKPAAPTFTYTVQGYTGGIVEGITGTSASSPYKIPINNATPSNSNFQITSGLPGIADYTYTWTMTDGSTTKNYTGNQKVDKVTDSGTVLHDRPAGVYTYTISLVASYNGTSSVVTENDKVKIYYTVTADFLQPKHFNFDNTFDDPDTSEDESDTVQKIYAVDNNVSQIYAAFNAGGTNFDTVLYFSTDNKNFTPIQIFTDIPFTLSGRSYSAQPNDATHQTVRPYTVDSTTNYLIFNLPVIAQLANTGNTSELINVMQRSGVKYFKAYVDDFNNGNVVAAEPDLHTTVGTSSTGGARPIYFKESTSNTFPDTRLMAYFLNSSGEMTYQTAADYNSVVTQIENGRTDRAGISRFYAPSDAVSVCFAYTTTSGYVLPSVSNGSLGFGSDNTVFTAYTDVIPLDSDYNMYKATASTNDDNSMKHYTGTWTKLDMDTDS